MKRNWYKKEASEKTPERWRVVFFNLIDITGKLNSLSGTEKSR